MMKYIERFSGKWTLVSGKAVYELGEPPQSGSYEIIENNGVLTFKMAWVDSKGNSHALEYAEICDGEFHDYPVKEIADEIRLNLTNPDLLESTARKNGKTILSAKRELISYHQMKVTMSGLKPDGTAYDNVSWYAK